MEHFKIINNCLIFHVSQTVWAVAKSSPQQSQLFISLLTDSSSQAKIIKKSDF